MLSNQKSRVKIRVFVLVVISILSAVLSYIYLKYRGICCFGTSSINVIIALPAVIGMIILAGVIVTATILMSPGRKRLK